MASTCLGQVVINEAMSSNFGTFADENGQYDDWIELYNAGSGAVDLSGYGLSDNVAKPYKFTFPSYQLASHDHLVIFTDDTNVTVIGSHWESAAKAGDTWRYRANTNDPVDTNWRNLSFNENVWSSGPGGIGYSDGDDATVVSQCASVFMRKTFTISDTSKIMDAILNIDYDDAFVAYLNGVEIGRANVGVAGTRPAWNTLAYSSFEAVMYQGMQCDSAHLDESFIKSIIKNGTNVFAIEVHNKAANDGDLSAIPFLSFRIKDATTMFSPVPSWFPTNLHPKNYFHAAFKISNSGETIYLSNPSGTVIDQVLLPSMELDNSYGRNTDGDAAWRFFGTATPDTTNSNSTGYTGYATIPLYSKQAGFYTGTQTLSITTTFPGGVIRYTTNGDAPTSSSTLYTAPLTISSTTSVRARVFSSTSLPSPTITNTYFINVDCKLPVYCLTLDSADLWDYNKGIFVKGPNASPNAPYFGANYWQDWEKYSSVEFFDKYKNCAFKFNAGLSITGGWSRRMDQKSLEIRLGDKFGLSKIQYQMLPDKKWIDKWDDFLLHTTGNDRGIAHMRDPVMERLMSGTNSDYTAYEPCLLYINGAQWGVYYTKENDDHNFVKENYGYSSSEIDLLKESYFYPDIEVKQGSDTAFRTMHTYATTTSPSSAGFYSTMDSMLDIKNEVDYFAAECYYPNDDWMGGNNNNLKIWRPRKTGGRFRYILYDLDFGFGISGTVSSDILSIALNPNPHNYNSDIFQRLLQNTQYKNYFINRYADLINTIWQQSNVVRIVNNFRDSIRYDMHFQYAKWGGGDTNTWNNNIASMLTFSNGRPLYARNQIQSDLGMTGQVTLTLQASPAGSGRIQISTITPNTLPWSGVYFNGNPVTVTAIPNPGYTFNHWHSNVGITVDDTNLSVTRNFTANDVITAYFTGSAVNPLLTVSEINYNSDSASNSGDWIELHNMNSVSLDISGWKVRDDNDHHTFIFPTPTRIAANGYMVVSEDTSKFHSQFPAVTNVIGVTGYNFSDGGDQVRLFRYDDSLYLSLEYSDQDPWPNAADGHGYTLELKSSSGDLNDGSNWFAGCPGGSPGRAYSAPVAAFSSSRSASICPGDTIQFSANVAGGNSYQWSRNHVAINGATNATFMTTQSGIYFVTVTNNGCTAISDSINVTVNTRSADPITTTASNCGSGSLMLHATASDSVSWYDAQNNFLSAGSDFTTPTISQSTVYFARAGSVCPSAFVADTAIINTVPSNPIATASSVCGHGIMTLTATSNSPVKWYDAPNGNLLFSGNSLLTPDINQSTTYYAQAGTICLSNFIPVTATVNPVSTVPVAASVSRCDTGSITLNAVAADTIRWYDAPNGNLLSVGASFQTPVLGNSMTYYMRAGSLCPSAFVPVQAIISSVTPDPVVSNQSRCGAGSVLLAASATDTVRWYDAPNGNLLFTGTNFTTPSISQNTTYFLSAGLSCPSNIVSVDVTINPVSPDPVVTNGSRCGSGSVTLTATATDTIRWYNSPGGNQLSTGNNFTTTSLTQTTNYYVRAGGICPSAYVQAVATINPIPPDPVVTSASRCGAGSLTLAALSTDTVKWYNAPGGNLLSTGTQFTTPSIIQTTTYYVQSKGICAGNYIPVQAIINNIPNDVVTSNQSRCGQGTITLTASSADTIRWYDSPNGNLLATGNSFTTPSLLSSTVYYVRAENICQGNFITVDANVNPLPSDPVTSNQSRCGTGSVTLNASALDTIRWYDAPNGNLLATGNNFTTPAISSSTVYYVRDEGTCNSNYIAVNAFILTIPSAPIPYDQSRCGSSSFTLTASGTDTIRWYDSPNGNLLAEGNTFNTPLLIQTTSYSIRTEDICNSGYAQVHAVINSVPVDPSVVPGSTCGSGTVVLIASSTDTVQWFDSPNGNILGTGLTFQTPVLYNTTTYFAEASNGCVGNFIPVNAVVLPTPQINLGNDTIIESGTTVSLDAGPGFTTYLWSTGETTQTTAANSTGNYWVSVTDANGCSAVDTIQVLVTVNVQPYVLTGGVLIYPNPTHSTLSISFMNENNEDIYLRLIDNNGKLVWNDFSVAEKRVMRNIDLSQFSRGLYVFQMATSKTKKEYKIVLK